MTSKTGVLGPLPAAMPRTTISRSVIMPTIRSGSPTGMNPMSLAAIMRATSPRVSRGLARMTSRLMTSLICMMLLQLSVNGPDRRQPGDGRSVAPSRRARSGDFSLRIAVCRHMSIRSALAREEADMKIAGLAVLLGCLGTAAFPAKAETVQYFPVPEGDGPHDVAPAPDGTVWYTAQGAGAIGRLDPATGKVERVPLVDSSSPHGVIVGPDGAAWVTDSG